MTDWTPAYIFDFDGVLANTMEAHFACYRQALAEAGVPIDRERFFYQAGMTGHEQIRYFANCAGVTVDVQKVYERNQQLKSQHIDCVTAIESNLRLLRALRRDGCPVAIATGSTLRSILPLMRRFAIEVDATATAEEIRRGKPHPDLFLLAAQKLATPPEHCTVFEDAEVGVQAAQAAGMSVMRYHFPTLAGA